MSISEGHGKLVVKTKRLNPHLPQERRLRSLFDVVRAMLCPSESPFHNLKCLKLECPNCGIQKLKRHLEVEKSSLKNVVNWSRWEANKETKKKMIVFKNGSLKDLIAEFLKDTETFSMHLFNAQWQHKEFVDMKTNPGIGTCVSVMDFAENYRCLLQDEIQSAHWSYSQVTLHPVVNYYKCQGCNKTVTDVVAIVSDDLVHDTHAVSVFADRVFQHLQAKSYTFERIVQWTDGCGAQYKCKDAFHDLHSLKKMANRVERNFFGSRHGKNACDGESAVIKRTITQAVKARRVIVQSAAHFFAYCKTHLVKPDFNDGQREHYRRDFIFVTTADISRSEVKDDFVTVKGTRTFHSIKSVGPLAIQTRSLSCFCHGCENDNGSLYFNDTHVDPWKHVEIKVKRKVSRCIIPDIDASQTTIKS